MLRSMRSRAKSTLRHRHGNRLVRVLCEPSLREPAHRRLCRKGRGSRLDQRQPDHRCHLYYARYQGLQQLRGWRYERHARGMLGWKHAFGDTVPTSTQAFAGSDAFTVVGAPVARNAAIIGAGLDFDIAPSARLGVYYSGEIASKAPTTASRPTSALGSEAKNLAYPSTRGRPRFADGCRSA